MQLRILWVGAHITPQIPNDFHAEIMHVTSAEQALSRLAKAPRIDVVIAADSHNFEILNRCALHSVPYIAGMQELSDKTRLELISKGVTECVTFPATPEMLQAALFKARSIAQLHNELVYLRRTILDPEEEFVGRSDAIREILRQKNVIAATGKSLLVTGSTGTGKHAFAREVHRGMSHVPFLMSGNLNSPASLLQEDLFDGGVNGPGLVSLAFGGTIVLPEISDMPLALQERLVPIVESAAVRVICLSRRDPDECIKQNTLSPALLGVLTRIDLPLLRQREGDIILLAEYFLRRAYDPYNRGDIGLDLTARESLLQCQWHANVAELKYVITRAKALYSSTLITSDMLFSGTAGLAVPAVPAGEATPIASQTTPNTKNLNSGNIQLPQTPDESIVTFRLGQPLQEVEREMLLRTLDMTQGNRTKTANILGISVRTLFTKLQEIEQQKGSIGEKNPKTEP